MANIPGTTAGEPLDGTSGDDVINANDGNDTVNGLDGSDDLFGEGGDDTLDGGLGRDDLFGGDGNDILLYLDSGPNGETFDGGPGTDTLRLNGATNGRLLSSTLTSIEKLEFGSSGTGTNSVLINLAQITGSGLNTLIGTAEQDVLSIITSTAGSYTMPEFAMTGFAPGSPLDTNADALALVGNGTGSFTLTAREGLSVLQVLVGGNGNDVLNGSANGDGLNGRGGVDTLNGMGGDDVLSIVNSVGPLGGAPANYTGAGSVFNGGDGTDLFGAGGTVFFQGTLQSIEGFRLLPASGVPGTANSFGYTELVIDKALLASLPADFIVKGTGTIFIDLAAGESLDLSAVQYDPAADVLLYFASAAESNSTPAQAVTWVGSSGKDVFELENDNYTVTDGGGENAYVIDVDFLRNTSITITDFTPGTDLVTAEDFPIDIASFGDLLTYFTQVGNDVVGSFTHNGATLTLTLQNLSLASLTPADFGVGAVPTDFTADNMSDILWRNSAGHITYWASTGTGFANDTGFFATVGTDWSVAGDADINGDGYTDILWRNSAGHLTFWEGTGSGFDTNTGFFTTVGLDWQVAALGDVTGDGKADIVWRNTSGAVTFWEGTGTGFDNNTGFFAYVDSAWQIAGLADFDGDGDGDLLWRNSNGAVTHWSANGTGFDTAQAVLGVGSDWQVAGTGDFDGDERADVLWRNTSGFVTVWNGTASGFSSASGVMVFAPTDWQVADVGDYNDDGTSDILWRNNDGGLTWWAGTGNGFNAATGYYTSVGTDWVVEA